MEFRSDMDVDVTNYRSEYFECDIRSSIRSDNSHDRRELSEMYPFLRSNIYDGAAHQDPHICRVMSTSAITISVDELLSNVLENMLRKIRCPLRNHSLRGYGKSLLYLFVAAVVDR